MEQVKIYYNKLFISDDEIEIYADCPSIMHDKDEAEEYADEMLDWGEWDSYVIPELTNDIRIIYNIN
jgi:hypothetical protein